MSRRNRRAGGGRHNRWDDGYGREPRPRERGRQQPRRAARQQRRGNNGTPSAIEETAATPFALVVREEEPLLPTCGRCREFVADDVSGRGECLHPGSGVLRPWWDTPGCPFFER